MAHSPARERCARHGLAYDPRVSRGCALCRREQGHGEGSDAASGSHGALSWLRVAGAVVLVIVALSAAWQYTSFRAWVERTSRSALAPEPARRVDTGGELDPEVWRRSLQHWERFEADAQESPRLAALKIASYVPRDNLVQLEGRVTGRRPNRSEVIDGQRQLDRVLLRYPERLLQALGLERLVWVCEIVKDGAPVHAFTLPLAMTLVVDPVRFDPGIFHHELFHLLDYRLHGPGDQPAWDALNPPGARYLGIDAYAKRLQSGAESAGASPYFLTDYASATAVEDRAEVFRVLMVDPALARARRADSPVIDAKARYVLAALDRLAEDSSIALGLR